MKLNILHLYPDLLNLYGDKGNIETLKHRLIWRGIDCGITEHTSSDADMDLSDVDIIVLGGGTDREEKTVMNKLAKEKDKLIEYVNSDGTLLALCGGMDMLGRYCEYGKETVEGPAILDIYTKSVNKRMTGDVVLDSLVFDGKIVGFENRAAKTYISGLAPLGKTVYGGGNNGEDKTEGVVYKNVIGTHLHGPILPKNPKLCDYVISCALKKKYADFQGLSVLDDNLENMANEFIIKRYQ